MKLNPLPLAFTLGGLCAAAALVARTADAQSGVPFKLSGSTTGGGGTSGGGQFVLSGTIGQPDAGVLTGGSYKLHGGIGSNVDVQQTPGAPLLGITLLPGDQARLSWPVSVTGFTLEETGAVGGGGSWITTPQSVVDTATEHTVIVPAAGTAKCYRLKAQ